MANELEVKASLLGGKAFLAEGPSGHSVKLDAAKDNGGEGDGLRPMELLAIGLAGCAGMNLVSILRKMRHEVVSYDVKVTAERSKEPPSIFTALRVEHIVSGPTLTPEVLTRGLELTEKYCPASVTLSKAAPVVHTFTILPLDVASGDAD